MPKQKVKKGARTLGPEYKFNYAYIWYNGHVYKPGSTLRAPAGATLTARAWVRNTNNVSGTACYGVVWSNYYRCGPKTKDIDAGKSWVRMPDCTFSMPSSDKDAVLKCGSYEGGTCYTHDTTDAIRLRVEKDTELICKDADKTAVVGDTLDLEVKLKDKATGAGINGKWIEFYKLVDSSEVSIGSCTTDSNGECSITYTCNVAETATIKAKFEGDDEYNASECTFTISVSKKPTDLTCYNKSAKVGQSVDLEAKLEFGDYPYYPIEDEWIYFYVDGNYAGRDKTDANGIAKVSYTPSSAGTYTIKAVYKGSSKYYVDSDTATLTVTAPTHKCNQPVKVIDPAGNPIEDATVSIDMDTYSILCEKPDGSGYGTDANGNCNLRNLDEGTLYTACASKAGYERYGTEGCKLFQACSTLALILKLYKPCEQQFLVLDQDNNPIEGATVTVTPGDKTCTTDSDGICKVSGLAENASYSAEASKGGYECFDSECKKGFRCMPNTSVILRLKKKATPTPPPKAYTELTCIDSHKTAAVGDTVDLKVRLLEAISPKRPLDGRLIKFYKLVDSTEVSIGSCATDPYGKCSITYTCSVEETATIKAKFEGDADYKESECTFTIEVAHSPYEITITVKDEGGNPIEDAYVSVLKAGAVIGIWSEVPCSDMTIYKGECTTESWKGRGNLLKTGNGGVVKIGLPSLPLPGQRYKICAGKPGYLNEDMHEDFGERTTRYQGENGEGEGTYEFEFTLRPITEEDKFIVHTKGFKEGDTVLCRRAYAWSRCFIPAPGTDIHEKKPDRYPDGEVVFTKDDGLVEGETYGIGPNIAKGFLPTGPAWCGEFRGIRDITLYRYGVFGMACELLGIPEDSDECRRFWAEMLDPIYCADVISGVIRGKDIYGAKYHPDAFELAMFPIVVVCSLLPMVPGGKITKYLGKIIRKGVKYGDDVAAVREFIETDPTRFYRAVIYGDEAKVNLYVKAIADGDIENAVKLEEEILLHPAIKDSEAISKFHSWLDVLDKQIKNIDPSQVDTIANEIEIAKKTAKEVLEGIGKYDIKFGSGKRLAEVIANNWDGALKLAKRAEAYGTFFDAYEKIKYGRDIAGKVASPTQYDYAVFLSGFNAANRVGDFSATGLMFSELAAYAEEEVKNFVRTAFTEEKFWHFWRVASDEAKAKYVKFLCDGNIDDAADLLDDVWKVSISPRAVDAYADEIETTLSRVSFETLETMLEETGSHPAYRNAFETLRINYPDEYAKLLDDAYPAYITTLRYGDRTKNITVFIKATDAVCSPKSVHCMFTSLYLPMYIADILNQLPRTHVTDWATKIAKAYKKYPQVRTYLRNNRALINEAMMKGDISKIDEFVDILFNSGDTTLAHSKLQEAVTGLPPGTIRNTSRVVDKTIETLDDLNAKAETRRLAFESFDEAINRMWLQCVESEDELYRVLRDEFVPLMELSERVSEESNRLVFKKIGTKWGRWNPTKWHGKVAALGAEGKLTIGGETIDLRRLLIALYDQGITSEDKPLFNSIFRALAHAREEDLKLLAHALDTKNYDSVIRILNDLPEVDMEPHLLVRAFNARDEKLLQNFVDKYVEITRRSGFNLEEITEFNRLTEEKLLWYRFKTSDDIMENFVYNALTNVSRGEKITDAGKSCLMGLSYNNPKVMRDILRELSDDEFRKVVKNLGENTPEARLLRRLRDITDDALSARMAVTQTDEWTALVDANEDLIRELKPYYAAIKDVEYKGNPGDIATTLGNEFAKINRPRRLVAELDRVPKSWRAAHPTEWGEIKAKAFKRLGELEPDWPARWKYMVIDKDMKEMLKDVSKDIGKWLVNYKHAIPIVVGVFTGWWGYSLVIAWTFYEELPQGPSIRMYTAYKDGKKAEVATELDFMEGQLRSLEAALNDPGSLYFYLFPIWKKFARDCLKYHWDTWRSFSVLIGRLPATRAKLEKEGYMVHAQRIIDGDTFESALTEDEMKERLIGLKEWAEKYYAGPPPVEEIKIPLYGSVRLAGIQAPDKPNAIKDYHTDRIETVGGPREIHRTNKACYEKCTEWLYEQIKGRDVKLLVDPNAQYDEYNRVLGVVKYGNVDICKRSLEDGASMVFFYKYNKYVDSRPLPDGEFLKAEKTARDNKLLLWSSECKLCPATGAWFNYYSGARESVRVGVEATFEGHAKGCDDSKITDWEWVFPHDVKKTGRVVTHTFTEAGSYEIHLKICAGIIDVHRTITVSKAYEYRKSPCGNYGNVNNDPDNYVTDEDAKLVMDYVELGWGAVKDKVGGLSESEFKERADVDGDGEVTSNDADMIYAYYAGSDTGRDTFPVCPGAPPAVKNVRIIAPSTVNVGESATLIGMASTEDPYEVTSWTWTISDPDGIETEKTGKTITHTFDKVGVWGIRLEACNNATPPNCGTATHKITAKVVTPVGELTIATFESILFKKPCDVATFFIDGKDKGGGYAVTATLPEGPHTVEVKGKEGEFNHCYVDILDRCFSPSCAFSVDVKANETTVVKVCKAAYIYLSAYSGTDGSYISATFYYKPYDIAGATYKEIATGELIPYGRHYIKAVATGHETLEMIISVSDSGISCGAAISRDASCYAMEPSMPAHGLYCRNFIVKAYLKKGAVTKTVTFESEPEGATITVLD